MEDARVFTAIMGRAEVVIKLLNQITNVFGGYREILLRRISDYALFLVLLFVCCRCFDFVY